MRTPDTLPADRLLPFLQRRQSNNAEDTLLPSYLQHVPNDILTKGYSIIPAVFTTEECNKALDQLWDFVQDTSGNVVKRHNPKTWYPIDQLVKTTECDNNHCHYYDNKNISHKADGHLVDDPWPHTGYSSFPDMFQSLGAGYLLGNTRLQMAQRIFEPLLGTKDLHASKEGFTFSRPTCVYINNNNNNNSDDNNNENECTDDHYLYKWYRSKQLTTKRVCGQIQEHSLGEHYDQSYNDQGLQTIQSSVCFIDQHKECGDGHFACIPFSHSSIHQSITKDIYRGKFSWVPLTHEEVTSICKDYNLQTEHIYVNAGDVIVWRSDLIHAAVPPSNDTLHFRAVGYFSMSPACWTPNYPDVWIDKINAYKWGKTGDHRSFVESWHDHKRQLQQQTEIISSSPCSNEKSDAIANINWIAARQRPYYRYTPPKVTKRLAELYGLLPSNLSKDEETEKAIQRATIRGVRFVECLNQHSKHLHSLPTQPLCTAISMQLTLENNTPLLGQDKYLGGVCSPDGNYIYGVPGHAKRVLRVNTKTNEMDFIGPSFQGEFKWLRGVDIPPDVLVNGVNDNYNKGCCLALPSNANSILKIDCNTHEVTTFGTISEKGWLYHGGNLAIDGFVYAIPANATRVLKIDPKNETTEFIGPIFDGLQKWFGGIMGSDNCVYGIPQNASRVLKINPLTQECSLIGEELGNGMWKWHGGLAINEGKQIIGFPNNADSVLVIDVEQEKVFTVGDSSLLKSGRHRIPQDRRYKWLGGATSLDGRFSYLFPCDAERVLRLDNETLHLSLIGPELLEGENKYQNGFVSSDGCIYGIPQRAAGVLRIIPGYLLGEGKDDEVDVLYCGDENVHLKDKFEGGVIDKNGCIYCIPLRAKTLMKIIPTEDISS